jgi:hypothetical protein
MIRCDTYFFDGTRRTYQKAKDRKDTLRAEGWRVKIRKGPEGLFEIWKKHRDPIDTWNNDHRFGNRKQGKKPSKKMLRRLRREGEGTIGGISI